MTARCKECGILADTPKAAHDLIHALYESLAAHRGSLREVREYAEAASEALDRIAVNAEKLASDPDQTASSKRMWVLCAEEARAALTKNPNGSTTERPSGPGEVVDVPAFSLAGRADPLQVITDASQEDERHAQCLAREAFIVAAHTDYEGYDIVRVFGTRGEADTLVAACNAYPRSCDYPYPSITLEDDEYAREEAKYTAARDAWAAEHPAGAELAGRDSYSVIPAPFGPKVIHEGRG